MSEQFFGNLFLGGGTSMLTSVQQLPVWMTVMGKDLVLVSVSQLLEANENSQDFQDFRWNNWTDDVRYGGIKVRANDLELEFCSLEVVSELRRQYEQPADERLFIGMESFEEIQYGRLLLGILLLENRGSCAGRGNVEFFSDGRHSQDDRFVFVRPR